MSGASGIGKIEGFETSDLACQIAGQVPEDGTDGALVMDDFIEPKERRKLDRFIQLGIIAGVEAVEHSGWNPTDIQEQDRTGGDDRLRHWRITDDCRNHRIAE